MNHNIILFISCILTCCNLNKPEKYEAQENRIQYWELKTGSRIAYIHVPASNTKNSIPLIFLHGGPGAGQVNSFGKEAPESWYMKLAKNKFDIYIYDQAGSGLSDRIPDPAQYSVNRHVEDLECIRELAGGKPCILIGDSWGAILASHYMAKYPENVIKTIFTSPGSFDFRDWYEEYSRTPRFPSGWFDWVYNKYGQERLYRYFKLDSLMQYDINAAYKFAGDTEMDSLADEFITSKIFKTCVYNKAFTKSPEFRMRGMGWWASMMTSWDLMNLDPIKGILKTNTTPVLILRGDYDYLHQGIAEQYNSVFPVSKLVEISKSGHFIWLDRPEKYRNEIEKFLF